MKSEKQCKNKMKSFILFNKEIENIKRTKILELKNTMTKWENSVEDTKQRISELEDRSFETV